MAFLAAFILGFYFVFLAHSCLLYFLVADHEDRQLALSSIVLPWPSRGKAVSILALLAGLPFLYIAFKVWPATDAEWRQLVRGLPWLLVFCGLPALCYGAYIVKRVRKQGGKRVFVASQATVAELRMPALVAVAINALYLLAR